MYAKSMLKIYCYLSWSAVKVKIQAQKHVSKVIMNHVSYKKNIMKCSHEACSQSVIIKHASKIITKYVPNVIMTYVHKVIIKYIHKVIMTYVSKVIKYVPTVIMKHVSKVMKHVAKVIKKYVPRVMTHVDKVIMKQFPNVMKHVPKVIISMFERSWRLRTCNLYFGILSLSVFLTLWWSINYHSHIRSIGFSTDIACLAARLVLKIPV